MIVAMVAALTAGSPAFAAPPRRTPIYIYLILHNRAAGRMGNRIPARVVPGLELRSEHRPGV
jgi:hypothetical protein